MNDGLIAIWRKNAKGEEFGEFIYNCVAEKTVWQYEDESEAVAHALKESTYADLLRMARERFGIEP